MSRLNLVPGNVVQPTGEQHVPTQTTTSGHDGTRTVTQTQTNTQNLNLRQMSGGDAPKLSPPRMTGTVVAQLRANYEARAQFNQLPPLPRHMPPNRLVPNAQPQVANTRVQNPQPQPVPTNLAPTTTVTTPPTTPLPMTPGTIARGDRLITRQELQAQGVHTKFFGDGRYRAIKSDLKHYHNLLASTDLTKAKPKDLQKLDNYLTHIEGKATKLVNSGDSRAPALNALKTQITSDRAALALVSGAIKGQGADARLVSDLNAGALGPKANLTLNEAVAYLSVGGSTLTDAAKFRNAGLKPATVQKRLDDFKNTGTYSQHDAKTLIQAKLELGEVQAYSACKPAPTVAEILSLAKLECRATVLTSIQKRGGTIAQVIDYGNHSIKPLEAKSIIGMCVTAGTAPPSGQDVATVRTMLKGNFQDATQDPDSVALGAFFAKGGTVALATQFQAQNISLPDAARILTGGKTAADFVALTANGKATPQEAVNMLHRGIDAAGLQLLQDTHQLTLAEAKEYAQAGCTAQEKTAFTQRGYSKEETLALSRQGFSSRDALPGLYVESNRGTQPPATKVGGGATGKTFNASYDPPLGGPSVERFFARETTSHPTVEVWGMVSPSLSPTDFPRTAQRELASQALQTRLGFTVLARTELATLRDPVTGELMAGVAMAPAKGKQGGDVDTVVVPNSMRPVPDKKSALWDETVQKTYGGDRQKFIDYQREAGFAVQYNTQTGKWEQGAQVKVPHDVSISSSELREQFSRLQILDIISGQRDRHSNNYFVQVVNGKPLLVAIDNDMSWGTEIRDKASIMSGAGFGDKALELPPCATQADINAVMQLTDNQLTQMLQGFSQSEIDAAHGRLQALKDHFQSFQPDQILPSWGSPLADQALAKYGTGTNSYLLRDALYFKP